VVDTSGSITGDGKGVPENKDIVLNFIKAVVRNLHVRIFFSKNLCLLM